MSTSIIKEQQETLKKFNLTLLPSNTDTIIMEDNLTTITGTTNYILQSTGFEGNNRVIPNVKTVLKGSFELTNESETVELESDLTLEEAKKEILEYLDTHKNAQTSDIIFDLCIDPDLVLEALNSLEKDDLVEGKPVEY
jgi:hypothetical protein